MKKVAAFILCAFLTVGAFAQAVFTPSLDFFSLITFKKDKPYISPSFDMSVNFNVQAFPQAYFDMDFHFLMDNPLLFFHSDKSKRKPVQAFFMNTALTFPNIKNKNIYLSLFYGEYDYLNSDKILRETAKVKMESPDFQRYYPTAIFAPNLKVDGLGVTIYGSLNPQPVYFAGYIYWNGNYTKRGFRFSADFRTGTSFTNGAVNAFLGLKIGTDGKTTELRTGVSGIFNVDDMYEFYFDAGLDKVRFTEKNLYKKIYALFEPRIVYDKFYFGIPFFMAPVSSLPSYMNNLQYAGTSFAGIGLKLAGGNLDRYKFEAGLSLTTSVNPQNIGELTAFTFLASPFCTCAIGNYNLDVRVNIYPVLYKTPENMVNLSIQFKAVR